MAKAINWDRARTLYDEGLTDLEIAEQIGSTKLSVGKWRQGKCLKANTAAALEPAPIKAECGGTADNGYQALQEKYAAEREAETGGDEPEQPPAPKAMTAEALRKVLGEIAADAGIRLADDDLPVVSCSIRTDYGADGTAEDTVVYLYTQ